MHDMNTDSRNIEPLFDCHFEASRKLNVSFHNNCTTIKKKLRHSVSVLFYAPGAADTRWE